MQLSEASIHNNCTKTKTNRKVSQFLTPGCSGILALTHVKKNLVVGDDTFCSQTQHFFIHRAIANCQIFTALEVVHDEGLTEKLKKMIIEFGRVTHTCFGPFLEENEKKS